MEEKFKFLELKITLKDGNTVSTKESGTLCINDHRVFFRCDRISPAGFQCGFLPLDVIRYIGFDQA